MEADAVPVELRDLPLYARRTALHAEWPVLLAGWRQIYPDLDVLAEVRKAHHWEMINPNRRKRNTARFLNSWLNRSAADQARPRRGSLSWQDQMREREKGIIQRLYQECAAQKEEDRWDGSVTTRESSSST